MDAINILIGINLFVTLTSQISAAKKGIKTSLSKVAKRPKTYLQKVPPNISAVITLLIVMGIFDMGILQPENYEQFLVWRVAGLIVFVVFSWLQIKVFKSLGSNYSQEVVILKEHELHTSGAYKVIRHPQYLCQILSDLGAGIALMSYLVVPVVILAELPLFLMRASYEDKMLGEHFGDEFLEYKKKSGFILPFIG
ncbi:methyltransferase family protein [Bacteroidota bacterium]